LRLDNRMERPILIATASLDKHAFGPVRSVLEHKGYPVVVYQTDNVLSNAEQFCLQVDEDGCLRATYNDQSISPHEIGAAWYRKLGNYPHREGQDRARQLYVSSEISHLHDSIWSLYPDDKWLNSPENIRKADRRLGQLVIAREVGFDIPETVVSSDWDEITSRLLPAGPHSSMIVKAVKGVVSDQETLKALYTTRLDLAAVQKIENHVSPFPGMYQPFIDKHKEWRVTVVGEDVFAAEVFTDESAKVDWRTRQTTSSVEFKAGKLPDDLTKKCISYLGKIGLRYGAFDFIEAYDGNTIFLECNPNGQYGWLEKQLGFPISSSIASELIKIAKNS